MNEFDELLSGVYSATTLSIRVHVRQLRLRIGVLTQPVSIDVWYEGRSAEPFQFELAAEMNPALERRRTTGSAITETDAIRQAVRLLTQNYEDAVRQGKMPDAAVLETVER